MLAAVEGHVLEKMGQAALIFPLFQRARENQKPQRSATRRGTILAKRAEMSIAKALKNPGDISRVVKTSFGYHVLQLVSHQPDTQKSFADVRPEIVKKLRDSYISKQMDQYTGEIRGRKLDANPDLVATLRTRYLTPGLTSPADAMREDSAKQSAAEQDAGKP
jgi:hypothetical protein